jgi:hypothetical protein
MKLNVIWSRLHETAGKVKVEVIIEDENTETGIGETPRAPSSINRGAPASPGGQARQPSQEG